MMVEEFDTNRESARINAEISEIEYLPPDMFDNVAFSVFLDGLTPLIE